MRSLVPIVFLAGFSLAAFAQSTSPQAPAATPPKIASVLVIDRSGISGPVNSNMANLLVSPTLRAGLPKELAQAQAPMQECFTLRTYAPSGSKPASRAGVIERPYAPQKFTLRSTCSGEGEFEPVPLYQTPKQ